MRNRASLRNFASTFVCINKTKVQINVSKNILYKKKDAYFARLYTGFGTNYNLEINFPRRVYKEKVGSIAYRTFLIGYR